MKIGLWHVQASKYIQGCDSIDMAAVQYTVLQKGGEKTILTSATYAWSARFRLMYCTFPETAYSSSDSSIQS